MRNRLKSRHIALHNLLRMKPSRMRRRRKHKRDKTFAMTPVSCDKCFQPSGVDKLYAFA